MAMAGAVGRCLLLYRPSTLRLRLLRAAISTAASPSSAVIAPAPAPSPPPSSRHELLLERLRLRHLKHSSSVPPRPPRERGRGGGERGGPQHVQHKIVEVVDSFEELGLGEEVIPALGEMGISKPTEIQCVGVPAVLAGTSVVLGSHTGSGKTLAYLLPLVQLLRHDEAMLGMSMKPRRPRAVVLCPTRELTEQVFRVAKSISHHARFRSTMVSGGRRIRPQEDSLNMPVDMVVGTPGRILDHVKDGNMVYGDIKYLVLDEADTMFDQGFGPDIRKFLAPLKNRAAKLGDQGFQTVLVTATMTKAVQKLIDEEFEVLGEIIPMAVESSKSSTALGGEVMSGGLDALCRRYLRTPRRRGPRGLRELRKHTEGALRQSARLDAGGQPSEDAKAPGRNRTSGGDPVRVARGQDPENARLKVELAQWRQEASLRPPEPSRALGVAAVALSDDEDQMEEENASYDEESPLHPDLQRVCFDPKFRAAKLPKYSEDSDPGEFSRSYALAIEACGGNRDTMAKCFPLALEGIANRPDRYGGARSFDERWRMWGIW
ncbi:hypothetical protein GUJ93_ZPchr0001g31272 [Zizania palustris]|uniref:Uncharacterized protein n=1 Tax=Zizania palustris TaxID=103762 RepID=A0A8J5VLT7_ZIZPA|nr:hypothetical protein GUJ93_ZPchr0001g31272 [Zizania palustris]